MGVMLVLNHSFGTLWALPIVISGHISCMQVILY